MRTRILLVDDHKILREGLRVILEKRDDVVVVAEADNGNSAVALAAQLRPDIVIMDIIMPDMNGIDATSQIVGEVSGIKIIALSMHSDKRYVLRMLKAGAHGYLRKDCASEELADAIETVLSDRIYISPQLRGFAVTGAVQRSILVDSLTTSILSPKEREVLQLLAEGKTTKQMAIQLKVVEKTIEKHRQRIVEKLDIHSIAELTKYAIREGITSAER
ncbi:MAG TPA: response regulator transcription factor [Bacteroidota bacterium]|jgi:DNA-binding NarL/FixJ family response regulator